MILFWGLFTFFLNQSRGRERVHPRDLDTKHYNKYTINVSRTGSVYVLWDDPVSYVQQRVGHES